MSRKSNIIRFIFFLIIFSSIRSNAQKLNIKNFSIDDGLPQSQILDNFQDHTGAIWFATNGGGISRFDGIKFRNFSTKDGLLSNHVFSIYEDENNVIWIGTSKGLNKIVNNKIIKVSDSNASQASVYCILRHKGGELWLGTSNGILIYNGKTFTPFGKNEIIGKFPIWSIKQDKQGNVWIGSLGNGTFCYNGNKIIRFGAFDGLNDLKNRDILINDNAVWVATYKGINVIDIKSVFTTKQKIETLELNGKPYIETTYRMYKDSTGIIWIGNYNGVLKVEKNKAKLISKNNGLCNTIIDAIIKDKEGNMWFGSFGGGLSKYRNNMFININEQQGLVNNDVTAFLKDSKDNMWIGTQAGGVSKLNYKAWITKDTLIFQNFNSQKTALASNAITGICEDKKGNIWFSTVASGVSKYDGNGFVNYDMHNGLSGQQIQAILADKKGNVWIGSEKGVDKYNGELFTSYAYPQGVSALYEDDLGYIWLGSSDKIIKYDGKTFTSIIRSEGFPQIKNIVKDKLGYIWFSTDAGASVFNGKIFHTINESDGLSSNSVDFIRPDVDGNLWMGTNKGLDRLDLDEYVNQKEVVLTHFGKDEGFIGGDCNPNSFYKEFDGKLWIGTSNGIEIFDPKLEIKNHIEPQLQLTGIRLFLENVDLTKYSDSLKNGIPQNLKLDYNKNHITFDFIGISQTSPTKVKYEYKLEGADINWSPEASENYARYSNLAPGRYIFLLKAKNGDGVWNTTPLSFSFDIIPPLWKRPWFYIITLIIGVSLIYTIIKIRERRLKYSKKLLERQVHLRTKQLFEEKEKLQVAYSEIDEKNKAITDSIHYAKRLQDAIIPTDATMKQLFPDSFVLYKPKDIVSGDFYWVEQWGHQTLIAAADCTGHGVPGAFMSIVGHNILTQSVNVLGLSKPALILNETNKQLSRKLNQNPEETKVMDGMDIALFSINYSKATMEFAGANNPLWIIRNNELIEIKGNRFPIGAYVGENLQKFTNHEWELQRGDYVYIFSDGYADQFGGPKGRKFMFKQLQKLLLDNHKKPLSEQKEILDQTFENWRGKLEQVDDVLFIGIKI